MSQGARSGKKAGGTTTVLFCWRKQSNVLLKFEPYLSFLSDCLSLCLGVDGLFHWYDFCFVSGS